jgi:hypothetical protein
MQFAGCQMQVEAVAKQRGVAEVTPELVEEALAGQVA